MGRCNQCVPVSIPQLEKQRNNTLDQICYSTYVYHTKCKKHGLLKDDKSRSCPERSKLINDNVVFSHEKITRRKEITLMQSNISSFHKDVYVPALNKYKYNIFLVSIMSKNYCKRMRYEAFESNEQCLFTERDYAERLVKELDGEIQSDHFGDNETLSIEGCTIQYHKKVDNSNQDTAELKYCLDFHSHFADFSKQDAATSFEHSCSMIDKHISIHGPLPKSCVIMEHTDSCSKQYRSGNLLYLMNVLSLKYNIPIDRHCYSNLLKK